MLCLPARSLASKTANRASLSLARDSKAAAVNASICDQASCKMRPRSKVWTFPTLAVLGVYRQEFRTSDPPGQPAISVVSASSSVEMAHVRWWEPQFCLLVQWELLVQYSTVLHSAFPLANRSFRMRGKCSVCGALSGICIHRQDLRLKLILVE